MNAFKDTAHTLPNALGWAREFTKAIKTRHFVVRTPDGQYYSPNEGDIAWSWGDEEFTIIACVETDGRMSLPGNGSLR